MTTILCAQPQALSLTQTCLQRLLHLAPLQGAGYREVSGAHQVQKRPAEEEPEGQLGSKHTLI